MTFILKETFEGDITLFIEFMGFYWGTPDEGFSEKDYGNRAIINEGSFKRNVYPVYAEGEDITFVMGDLVDNDRNIHSTEVRGYYFGKSVEQSTKHYNGKVKAVFDPPLGAPTLSPQKIKEYQTKIIGSSIYIGDMDSLAIITACEILPTVKWGDCVGVAGHLWISMDGKSVPIKHDIMVDGREEDWTEDGYFNIELEEGKEVEGEDFVRTYMYNFNLGN